MHSRRFRSAVIAASVARTQSEPYTCKFEWDVGRIHCTNPEIVSFEVISDWGKHPSKKDILKNSIDHASRTGSAFVVSCGDDFYGKKDGSEQRSDSEKNNDGEQENDISSNQTEKKKSDVPWLPAIGDHGILKHDVKERIEYHNSGLYKDYVYMPKDQFHVPVIHKNYPVLHILVINTSEKVNYQQKIDEAKELIRLIDMQDSDAAKRKERAIKREAMEEEFEEERHKRLALEAAIMPMDMLLVHSQIARRAFTRKAAALKEQIKKTFRKKKTPKDEVPTHKMPIFVFGHDPLVTSENGEGSEHMKAWYKALKEYPNVRLYVAGHHYGMGPVIPNNEKDIPMFLFGGGRDPGVKGAHGSASDSDGKFRTPKNFEDGGYGTMSITYNFRFKILHSNFEFRRNDGFGKYEEITMSFDGNESKVLKREFKKKGEKK